MPGFVLGASTFTQVPVGLHPASIALGTTVTLAGGALATDATAIAPRDRRVVRAVDVSVMLSFTSQQFRLQYVAPGIGMAITDAVTISNNQTHRFEGPFTIHRLAELKGECVNAVSTWVFGSTIYPKVFWMVHWADSSLDEGSQEYFRF